VNAPAKDPDALSDDFAELLAAATPAPGGGAAAARVGLYAAALVRMVSGISRARLAPDAPGSSELSAIDAEATRIADRFRELEALDVAAFTAYLTALRLPRSSPDELTLREAAVRAAAIQATDVPLDTIDAALAVFALADRLLRLAGGVKIRAESDIGAAVELANAALRAAELNVRVNTTGLGPAAAQRVERLAAAVAAADRDYARLHGAIRARLEGRRPDAVTPR
jgi:formiminotetrahydrofolate cyclodeaminase